MTGQELGAALRSGRRVYGTALLAPSPSWTRAVERSGLDFIFIDTEHITLDRAQVGWMCQTYKRMGLPPIVRIPAPDPYQATMALDDGAAGIVAPYVETVDEVHALRGALKKRPLKGARLLRHLTGEAFEPDLEQYVCSRNADHVFLVNIESVPAMEVLEEIVRVPDLDGILIGPHDLSCSLGVPEQYTHERFLKAVREIFQTARAAGIGAGIHFWGTIDEQVAFLENGANMLIHSADLILFKQRLSADLSEIRGRMGDLGAEGAEVSDKFAV